MKRFFKTGLLTVALLASASVALAQFQSFNMTNCLTGNSLVSGWPTNQISTNTGFGQGTGGPISVANNDRVGFFFQCFCATNIGVSGTTNQVQVQLIRACTGSPPGVSYGTNILSGNATNLQASDWETFSNTASPLVLNVPLPSPITNGITWYTNLDPWTVAGAYWIGIGQIQAQGTNLFLTNVVCGISKKIIPIRYP